MYSDDGLKKTYRIYFAAGDSNIVVHFNSSFSVMLDSVSHSNTTRLHKTTVVTCRTALHVKFNDEQVPYRSCPTRCSPMTPRMSRGRRAASALDSDNYIGQISHQL